LIVLFSGVLLILLFCVFAEVKYCQIVYDPSLTLEGEFWDFGEWKVGSGSTFQEWQNGVAYLSVSNPNGDGWVGCKLQQGSLPHGWHQAYPLRNSIIVNENARLFLKVEFRLGNYAFWKYPTVSPDGLAWFNFGVSLWLQRPNATWNSSMPQLEIGNKIIWFIYDGKNVTNPVSPIYFQGDLGNDYHSLFDVYNESFDNHDWQTVELEITPYVQDALKYWGESNGELKNVDVYLETIGGKGEVWIDELSITYVKNQAAPQLLTPWCQNPYIFAAIILAIVVAVYFLKKKDKPFTFSFK